MTDPADAFADLKRRPGDPRLCPRCNTRPKEVELIFQARGLKRPRPGAHATRARRLCSSCAREVFAAAVDALVNSRPIGTGANW